MKPNPKNYEGYVDPEGGEWIKIKTGMYKGAIWRPAEMKLVNEQTGEVSYQVELLGGDMKTWNTRAKKVFLKMADSIISDILGKGVVRERQDSDSDSSET
jgi:hypothetical protein